MTKPTITSLGSYESVRSTDDHACPVKQGKVGIVTGGGSGHLPVFLGYVGEGMLDGCAVGNVFASPSAQRMADMIEACNFGNGVLCLYGNYGGDNLNFDMACETVSLSNIETRTVRVKDDVASSPRETAEKTSWRCGDGLCIQNSRSSCGTNVKFK